MESFALSLQALYMVPVALSVAVIAAFQLPAFTERQNLGAVTLLLVLFGSVPFLHQCLDNHISCSIVHFSSARGPRFFLKLSPTCQSSSSLVK